jgi:hypothetical protein
MTAHLKSLRGRIPALTIEHEASVPRDLSNVRWHSYQGTPVTGGTAARSGRPDGGSRSAPASCYACYRELPQAIRHPCGDGAERRIGAVRVASKAGPCCGRDIQL